MSTHFWLTDAQIERLRPVLPKRHGRPRVDDRRGVSGIFFINGNGLWWRDAPPEYGPPKTFDNLGVCWSQMEVFARIMAGLASGARRAG